MLTPDEKADMDALLGENARLRLAFPCRLGQEPGCPNPKCWVYKTVDDVYQDLAEAKAEQKALRVQVERGKRDLKTLRAAIRVIKSFPE